MEHKTQTVISQHKFALRLFKYSLFAFILIIASIVFGVLGYHYIGELSWIDSFQMSCMILTGMGPTSEMHSNSAKAFSSFYAIYSGVSFLTVSAIVFSPIIHRVLHILHVEDSSEN